MEIRDLQRFEEWKAENSDPYGERVTAFAERWAEAMEKEMEGGRFVGEVAGPTRRKFLPGITGAMYASAVAMLAACWKHGEDLRQWHNLVVSPDHGVEANAKGIVLAPAMLTLTAEGPLIRESVPVSTLPAAPFPAAVPGEVPSAPQEQNVTKDEDTTPTDVHRDLSNANVRNALEDRKSHPS